MTLRLALTLALATCFVHAQNGSSFLDADKSAVPYTAATARPAADCAAFVSATNPDYSVLFARLVPAEGETPEHCQIRGVLPPEIVFDVNLPSRWNRRLYMYGNGGYAGTPPDAPNKRNTRNAALQRGFATAYTNTGHDRLAEPLGTFAYNNLQKEIDYSFRAVHLTIQTAKELAARYYEKPASYSYWDGCSTGGREGLMSAQRFPEDFDGIIAGAPVLDFSGTMLWYAHMHEALEKAPLTLAEVEEAGKQIYAKCDKLDGLEDGLIDDPRKCDFDPKRDLTGDFSAAQKEALASVYAPVMSNGKPIFPGLPLGAEAGPAPGHPGWANWIIREDGPTIQEAFMETFFRCLAFPEDDPDFDWHELDFDKDPARMEQTRAMLDATNPDLSRFHERGGKMLMHHGWADTALNPMMGVGYYEDVLETMGPETRDFFRFYTVPGMFHCRGGIGADRFDLLTPLVNWVETGDAPAALEAAQAVDGQVERTRKLCPYPERAEYDGQGDPNSAASFRCVAE